MNVRSLTIRLATLAIAGVAGLMFAGNALASTQHSQTRFYGACGGGSTFNDAVAGWRAHGVLDDIERAAHINPNGVDGPPLRLLRKAMVRVIVVRGTTHARNSTCTSGRFQAISRPASQPAGSFVWTLRWWVNSRTGAIRNWWADNCGNNRHGLIFTKHHKVKKPKPKKHHKPKVPNGNCNAVGSPGSTVCSTVTYVNVCGTQVVYNGDQKDLQTWIDQYIADHCQPTVTTTVCSESGASNYGQTGPCVFPPPTPPPPPPPAPNCYINPVQEVDESTSSYTSTTPVYQHCTATSGDVLNITMHDNYGTLSASSAPPLTANGSDQVTTVTYTAPTEVLTDTVYFHIVDTTTGAVTDVSVPISVIQGSSNPT